MQAEDFCEYLEWDSAFFGCGIARLKKRQLDLQVWGSVEAWCRSRGIDCLYFLCDAHDSISVSTAENHGFRLVDERLTMVHDVQALPNDFERASFERASFERASFERASADCVRLWIPEDVPALRAIAKSSHVDTRFYHDGNFLRSRCDAMYETWIEKSCHSARETVLVAELNSLAVGYVTCLRRGATTGQIGLLAVARAARGQGLGRNLIQNALCWFADQGIVQVTVVTQGRNIPARRLYETCGFVLFLMDRYYHRWFPTGNARIAG